MKIAVTGASGFVGKALAARLREAGQDVVPLSRGDGVDYEDLGAMTSRFEGADAVVHLAARAHRGGDDDAFAANARVARVAAQAARDAAVARFVLVSSIGVNGNATHGKPFTEDDAPAPAEAYARSKLRSEHEVRDVLEGSATSLVVVRPPLVDGPDAPGNMAKLRKAVVRGWPLPLASIANRRSFIGVDNLVDFLVLCVSRGEAAGELFVVADGEDLSTPQLVRRIAKRLGKPARLFPFPPAVLVALATMLGRERAARSLCESLQVDASKARRVLGWKPR
ncbi:MAG TPA: NAD-dependent epimerase/dehydratase family protein [Ramlibacter sp.]|nr:NAD-dependent epimerase/dehydratase family protein [Ramlibacter sp.]